LVSNIDPVINPNADLTLEDVKAELYFSFSYPFNSTNSQYEMLPRWVDDGYIDFDGGKLVVNKNNENKVFLTYSSGFLSLDSLNNLFINVPDAIIGSTIYLKIYYRFHRNDNPNADPVVLVNTYKPDVINKDSENRGPWSFYLNGSVNGNKIDLKWSDLFKESGATTLQIQESIDRTNWSIIFTKQNPDASFRTFSAIPNETGQYRFYRVVISDNHGMNVFSQVDKVVNPNYLPPSVTITGPTILQSGQTGTFTANVQGGTPPYQYAWYKYRSCGGMVLSTQRISPQFYAPCNSWQFIGSGQTVQTQDNLSFNLKVEITDGAHKVATVEHFVEVGGFTPGVSENNVALIPRQVELLGNYPNPFNPTTIIRFGLPQRQHVQLEIYSVLGQRIAMLLNREMTAGYHQVKWEGTDRGKSCG